MKHKAACLLAGQLESDPQWKAYASRLGQAKCAMQQTACANLMPPPRSGPGARFMNLDKLVDRGVKTLDLIEDKTTM